jgi:hypothetical protein
VSAGDRERLTGLVDSSRKLQAQQLLKTTPPVEHAMSQQLGRIRAAMDDYLSPALDPISLALQEEKTGEGLTVVLLADPDLLELPLEALSLLQLDCIKAIARDFSLQMHCHRIKKCLTEEEDTGAKKFQLQPSFLQANASNFQYILDPRCELNNSDLDVQPAKRILTQVNAFPKITAKWNGHKAGNLEDAMSTSQWHPILKQCSGLIFFGSERLLAHFPPKQLAGLSMKDCSIAIVVDHMQTLKSSLEQLKLDLVKSVGDLEAEGSVQTAALLSLVGVSCLIARQWHSSVDTCADTLCSFLKRLLSEGVGVADMRWGEVREAREQQAHPGIEQLPAEQSPEQKDHSSFFNSTVYGLPHLALNLPSQ